MAEGRGRIFFNDFKFYRHSKKNQNGGKNSKNKIIFMSEDDF